MEYIEKEKAARMLREEAAAHYPTAFHIGLYAAARAIDSIPAADVRPVVKATWIMPNADGTDRPMPECSHCGWYVDSGGMKDFSFCPNCGAVMEGS